MSHWIDFDDISFSNHKNIENIKDGNDCIVFEQTIPVLFSYPFRNEQIVEIKVGDSTRGNLAQAIYEQYRRIYEEEEETSEWPVETMEERCQGRTTMQNRAHTNGTWGIFGHNLDRLILRGMIRREEDAPYTLIINT